MQLPIICPSKDRAGCVLTHSVLNGFTLVVPHGQGKEYSEHNPENEVIETPKGIRGITATRQWCLDKWDELFFIDDDIYQVLKNFTDESEKCTPDEVRSIIEKDAWIAKQIGAKIFGYKSIRKPLEYHGDKMYSNTGYWNHSYCGYLKGHGIKFDLSFSEAEDYYVSAYNIYKNRYGLLSYMYTFKTKDNFLKGGGCSSYRTEETLLRNTKKLIDIFGSDVVKFKKATYSKKNIFNGERSLKFPY